MQVTHAAVEEAVADEPPQHPPKRCILIPPEVVKEQWDDGLSCVPPMHRK